MAKPYYLESTQKSKINAHMTVCKIINLSIKNCFQEVNISILRKINIINNVRQKNNIEKAQRNFSINRHLVKSFS